MNLSENLKNAREKAGLSQKDVADSLNISRQSVSKWETGKAYPDIENLVVLSRLYQMSLDDLVIDTQEPESVKTEIPLSKENSDNRTIPFNYESFSIIAVTLLSCIVPLIGLFLNVGIILFCIIKKQKISALVWMVLIVCLIINLVNAGIVLNNSFFKYGRATIQKVALLFFPLFCFKPYHKSTFFSIKAAKPCSLSDSDFCLRKFFLYFRFHFLNHFQIQAVV